AGGRMNNPIVIALEVLTLQRFLDPALLIHAPERLFVRVRAYYRLSPPIAHAVASQPLPATGVRALLGSAALGANFAVDQPAVAVGLAGIFLAASVGVAVMRGKTSGGVWQRIRARSPLPPQCSAYVVERSG